MAQAATPVVFVHGLWLHASSWNPWIELFGAQGYAPMAPGWPGEGSTVSETRNHPEAMAGKGINDIVEHYAQVIRGLDAKPIVIGHAMGGLIAQRLLGQDLAAAAVAINASPIKGVIHLPLSALRVAWITLRNPANRRRAVSLTPQEFRYGFGNALPEAESDELYERWTIPSPGRPIFEAILANVTPRSPAAVDTRKAIRGPLLLLAGGEAHTAPVAITRATRRRYRKSAAVTDYQELPGRGQSLTIDSGWREVADGVLKWLGQHVR